MKSREASDIRTLGHMMAIFCHARHSTHGDVLCPRCSELLEYARRRIIHCPRAAEKTTCRQCPVHCYAPEYRARISEVMRYAGPRMIWHHPREALLHLWREL